MFELVITAVMVPILSKLGDKLIDRVAGDLDARLVKLIKDAAGGGAAKKQLDAYLSEHISTASKLATNVREVLSSSEAATFIAAGTRGSRSRVELCREWLLRVFSMARDLGRPIAAEGFFSSPNLVSVFRNDFKTDPPEVDMGRVGEPEAYLVLGAGLHIYLNWVENADERAAIVTKLNRDFRFSPTIRSPVSEWDRVVYIYEFWVKPESLQRSDGDKFVGLPDDVRVRWELSPEGMSQFVRSVAGFVSNELADLAGFLNAADAQP